MIGGMGFGPPTPNDMARQQRLALTAQLYQQRGLDPYGTLGQAAAAAYRDPFAPPGPIYYGALGSLGASQGSIAPAEPIENAGIRAGEIIGWRSWRLKHGLLTSPIQGNVWAPGEPMMGRPDDHGLNGINAFKTQSGALTYALGMSPAVIGQVEMWGEVVEHEDGYRAEYAQIASLCRIIGDDEPWLPRLRDLLLFRGPPADDRLERLQREYGVGGAILCAAQLEADSAQDQRDESGTS